MKYKTIRRRCDDTNPTFDELVQQHLDEGWALVGGASLAIAEETNFAKGVIDGVGFQVQAMVKADD